MAAGCWLCLASACMMFRGTIRKGLRMWPEPATASITLRWQLQQQVGCMKLCERLNDFSGSFWIFPRFFELARHWTDGFYVILRSFLCYFVKLSSQNFDDVCHYSNLGATLEPLEVFLV